MLYPTQKFVRTNGVRVNPSVGFLSIQILNSCSRKHSPLGREALGPQLSVGHYGGGVGQWLLNGWKLSPQKHLFKI